MGKAGAAQDNKRCKIKKSGRGLQSMAADQLCITPWSHWLIWERLLAAQLSPSLLLRLPPAPHQPQLEPLSAGSYRVRQRKTQRASSPQVSLILYRGRLFDVNVSNPAHFRAKTSNQVEERGMRNTGNRKMEESWRTILWPNKSVRDTKTLFVTFKFQHVCHETCKKQKRHFI